MTTHPMQFVGFFFSAMPFYPLSKDLKDSKAFLIKHFTTVTMFKGRHLFSLKIQTCL